MDSALKCSKIFCPRVAVVNERSRTIVPKGLQHRLADDFTTLTETRKFFFPPSLLHTIFFCGSLFLRFRRIRAYTHTVKNRFKRKQK